MIYQPSKCLEQKGRYQIDETSDVKFKTLFQFQNVSDHDLQVFVRPNTRDTKKTLIN